MTVHFWGERPEGMWTLEIIDAPSKLRNPEVLGKVQQHSTVLLFLYICTYVFIYLYFVQVT